MAQSQHSITPEAGHRQPYDKAVFETSVALPAQAGIAAEPGFAPSALEQVTEVLAAWRAAERELSEHLEASAERMRIRDQVVAHRSRYHQLFEERLGRRDPPMPIQPQTDVFAWLNPEMLRRH